MTALFRETWSEHVAAASTILIAASKRAWPTLVGPSAAFPRDDRRLCRVPLAFRRPTHAEMRRIYGAMTRVSPAARPDSRAAQRDAAAEEEDDKEAKEEEEGIAVGQSAAPRGAGWDGGEDEVAALCSDARAWHARLAALCSAGDDAAAADAVTAEAASPWVGDALRALSRYAIAPATHRLT